jgi:uncharacterized Zn finger protein (UPF0148 family)
MFGDVPHEQMTAPWSGRERPTGPATTPAFFRAQLDRRDMEIRGERECRDCSTRWSYFETGSVSCPACGSVRSVGVGGRSEHTDTPATLDLESAREAAAADRFREAAREAGEAAADYARARGFVHAGDLTNLDDAYVAAQELRHAGVELARRADATDEERRYFLALLQGAPDGERPDVPASLRMARGLGAAASVRAYVRDVSRWLGDDAPPGARDLVESLTEHRKRLAALDGDVPPSEAATLVEAARDLGEYVRGEEAALARARERLAASP